MYKNWFVVLLCIISIGLQPEAIFSVWQRVLHRLYPRQTGRRPSAIVRQPENVQGRRQTWTQREKKSQKITNLNKAAFLLRPVRSYHVLTARPPRPLRAYGVSFEIYGLGNGDHRRSRGALATIMGFLPRVFYVYRECTATSGRFYHVLTATIY